MRIDPRPHLELIHPTAFVAPGAVVVGNVTIGAEASLWFGVVVRGDSEAVVIGPQSNIQDGSILHADPGLPCLLGARVSLGHGAIVHGARIEDEVLIGMRATVLNGAHVGSGSVVAAGAVITPGMVVPPQSMVMGLPAKVVRPVTPQDREMVLRTAQHYVEFGQRYREAYGGSKAQNGLSGAGEAGEVEADVVRLLRGLVVFEGLSEAELRRVASISRLATFSRGLVIAEQSAAGSNLLVVQAGKLEVNTGEAGQGSQPPNTLVNLGEGQSVGEMALIEYEPRSATVRCVSETCSVIVIEREAFENLCAAAPHIGLIVYRNLAAGMSIKLRQLGR